MAVQTLPIISAFDENWHFSASKVCDYELRMDRYGKPGMQPVLTLYVYMKLTHLCLICDTDCDKDLFGIKGPDPHPASPFRPLAGARAPLSCSYSEHLYWRAFLQRPLIRTKCMKET